MSARSERENIGRGREACSNVRKTPRQANLPLPVKNRTNERRGFEHDKQDELKRLPASDAAAASMASFFAVYGARKGIPT